MRNPSLLPNGSENELREMAQSDDDAYRIAKLIGVQCNAFCQEYSRFLLLKLRYKENAKNPLIEPHIDPLDDEDGIDEAMEYDIEEFPYAIFREIRLTIKDCHTIATAWEKKAYNDSALEAALATSLMLCPHKITVAARFFYEYHQLLDVKIQNALSITDAMNVGMILSLSGVKVTQVSEPEPVGPRAAKLLALGIDDNDVPVDFLCPVSLQIMEKPISMGNGDFWYTYDASSIARIAWEQKEDAYCPHTRELFSALTFKANTALDKQIDDWFEEKARPRCRPTK
ncbi:MAG: U-box domain-containing protein [Gammaproteobacteria bacterium]